MNVSTPGLHHRAVGIRAIHCLLAVVLLLLVSFTGAAAEEKPARIIVGFQPGIDIAAALADSTPARLAHPALGVDLALLGDHGITPRPRIGIPTTRVQAAAGTDHLRRLRRWASITMPEGMATDEVLDLLATMPSVEQAYREPVVQPAAARYSPAAATPKFVRQQGYLDAAPGGIGARHAWKKGQRGKGVTVADIEGDWVNDHHDLKTANAVTVNGVRAASSLWYDHGTAEIGLVIGTRNNYGITGIAFQARILLYSIYRADGSGGNDINIPEAIVQAAQDLEPGAIIYLPIEFRDDFSNGRGFCVEYYDDVFEAVQYAVDRGIVVIEAAGNGGLNLSGSIFEGKFNPDQRDSGAIIVGAGGTPDYRDLQRLSFSCYGDRVNLQNWGEQVVTTGYGSLHDGGATRTYTASFNGTSSATGITAGAAAVLQGYARSALKRSLTSREMRSLLVRTGTPQKRPASGKIGPRTDLQKALAEIGLMNDE